MDSLTTHLLTVVTSGGNGGGTVATQAPSAGINCVDDVGDCAHEYDEGTSVTLVARPAVGAVFAGWAGGGCSGTDTCTTTVTGAVTVTAMFTLTTHMLTVRRNGSSVTGGTITSSPAGIQCPADCTEVLTYGSQVTLSATPNNVGSTTFSDWSGGGCSGVGTCMLTITDTVIVTATFNSTN